MQKDMEKVRSDLAAAALSSQAAGASGSKSGSQGASGSGLVHAPPALGILGQGGEE